MWMLAVVFAGFYFYFYIFSYMQPLKNIHKSVTKAPWKGIIFKVFLKFQYLFLYFWVLNKIEGPNM